MATAVSSVSATITAGTAKASPLTVSLTVPTGQVDKIRWRVPPGPRGNLGWSLTMGGAAVIPDTSGEWIVADNELDEVAVDGLPDSGAWQVTGYNTGVYDHTVYLMFYTTPTSLASVSVADIATGFPTSQADIPTMWLT